MVWPGEKGATPGFRGFCSVGVYLLTVSSGESRAVSFDDSSSFTSCGLTSQRLGVDKFPDTIAGFFYL